MTKVYKLTTIETTTEATKEFFENNKFFFGKRLNNGHFVFVSDNREVLETSTCQHFNRDKNGNVVIETRNSTISLSLVIDDSEWFKIMPHSGYGAADVQYLQGWTAAEIAAKLAYIAIYNGFTLETFKISVNRESCNSVIVRVSRGDMLDDAFKSLIFTIHVAKYEFLGTEARVRIMSFDGETKTISLAGSPNQINKKIKAIFA